MKKENEATKDRINSDTRNLFEHEGQENCYEPVRIDNFWNNNYIEYESNCNGNKILSVEEYLRPYLKDI